MPRRAKVRWGKIATVSICPGTPCPESACRDGCLVGDSDHDGDLDLFDIDALQTWFGA